MGCSSSKQNTNKHAVISISKTPKLRWLGHAGFRLQFQDIQNQSIERVVYIDPWLENPKIPDDLKNIVPDDADLILITHGHFDHSSSAPSMIKKSMKKDAKIISNFELIQFYQRHHAISESQSIGMNKGGELDLGYCKIQMVKADHSSGCMLPDSQHMTNGGDPCGFIIKAKDFNLYHAGDTNVFGDMAIIDKLYQPTHLLLPIGGFYTMGPKEAAYATCRFLKSAKFVIPMHYGTFPLLKGTVEEFEKEFKKIQGEFRRAAITIIDPHKLLTENSILPL
eukprot:403348010